MDGTDTDLPPDGLPVDDLTADDLTAGRRALAHEREVIRIDRRAQAVQLRASGLTFREVGERLGISEVAALRLVDRTLSETTREAVGRLRREENTKLNEAEAAIWAAVQAGDVSAIDCFLRISARRARLNGLDAPNKLSVQVTPDTRSELDRAVDDLEAVLLPMLPSTNGSNGDGV